MRQFMIGIEQLSLKINLSKTKIIVMGKNNNNIDMSLNNTPIEQVNTYKYLGTILDKNLNFSKHLEYLKNKATERLNIFKIICANRNSIAPHKARTVYIATIRSILERGSSYTSNNNKINSNKLNSATHIALRRISGCTKTTPTNSLHAINAEVPLEIRRKYVASKEIPSAFTFCPIATIQMEKLGEMKQTRKKMTSQEKLYGEHIELLKIISTTKENDISGYIKINSSLKQEIEKKKDTNKIVTKQITLRKIEQITKDRPTIYTDGSAIQGKTGIGILLQDKKTDGITVTKQKI